MSIASIAERAGIHKTSLYGRWETKTALLSDALMASDGPVELPTLSGDIRRDSLILWITAPIPAGSGDLARSVAIARALAAATDDPDVAAMHALLWKRRLELTNAIIDAAVASGQLPEGADPRLLTDLLSWPFFSRVVVRNEQADAAFFATVMEAGLSAIGARNPRPGRRV